MSSGTKDITVILNCHQQGRLLHPSVRSVAAAIAKAEADHNVKVEWIFAADQPSKETTEYLESYLPAGARTLIATSGSETAQSLASKESQGKFISTISGNDLISSNWLSKAFIEISSQPANVVLHPAAVVVFGEEQYLYVTPDQDSPDFSKDVLLLRNPWPPTSFGPRELFTVNPHSNPSADSGFAYADWHWLCQTIADGVKHKPVTGTFSCCHRRGDHRCFVSETDRELLFPPSKLFQILSGNCGV